jgi:uroporphyrin-III C-methyltransferase/precorrin-2 dehydrogenase/sirohydrochlorin ferrochelatase
VTHRGLAAGLTVLSGHAESTYGPILDGAAPGSVTLVVLMGLANRAGVAARLLSRGWDAATPAAILLGASRDAAHVWRGTLAELGAATLPPDRAHLPGTLVVGAVAALALHSVSPRALAEAPAAPARAAEGA